MTFDKMIEQIMPEVERSSTQTFIVHRDKQGKFDYSFTHNHAGERFDWVEDVKAQDPFAVEFTGAEFNDGGLADVYDRIFTERLRAEYENASFKNATSAELDALMNFVEDNFGEFSSQTTEYLSLFDRPLVALYEMTPVSLASKNPDYDYDYDKIGVFIDAVEAEVDKRLNNSKKQEIGEEVAQDEREIFDGYIEQQSIQIAGNRVILAENAQADEPYMVCFAKWDNPFGMMEYYNAAVSDDYVEALQAYAGGIKSFTQVIQDERAEYGNPAQVLTAADCIPNGRDEDLTGKVIIIKAEALAPEYRRSEKQLRIATSGFGCDPNASGRAVYCKELYSGKESRFERYDVLGVADPERLPAWTKAKLTEQQRPKEPEQKQPETLPKTPKTLQEKLDNAKKKAKQEDAAKKSERGDKSNKNNNGRG